MSQNPARVRKKRFESMNVFHGIHRLIQAESFPKFLKHVDTHGGPNDPIWLDVCKEAEIPEAMRMWMQQVLFDNSIYDAKPKSDQAFCWEP